MVANTGSLATKKRRQQRRAHLLWLRSQVKSSSSSASPSSASVLAAPSSATTYFKIFDDADRAGAARTIQQAIRIFLSKKEKKEKAAGEQRQQREALAEQVDLHHLQLDSDVSRLVSSPSSTASCDSDVLNAQFDEYHSWLVQAVNDIADEHPGHHRTCKAGNVLSELVIIRCKTVLASEGNKHHEMDFTTYSAKVEQLLDEIVPESTFLLTSLVGADAGFVIDQHITRCWQAHLSIRLLRPRPCPSSSSCCPLNGLD